MKAPIKHSKLYIKLLAVILTLAIIIVPRASALHGGDAENTPLETTSSSEQLADVSENKDAADTDKEHGFHIGTTNIIGLAGAVVALAVVKCKEHNFLNKRK